MWGHKRGALGLGKRVTSANKIGHIEFTFYKMKLYLVHLIRMVIFVSISSFGRSHALYILVYLFDN